MPGLEKVSLRSLQTTAAGQGGLGDPTARVEISLDLGCAGPEELGRLAGGISGLWSKQPPPCPRHDWLRQAGIEVPDTAGLADWVGACHVGVMWRAQEPVGRFHVLSETKDRLVLLLPWSRAELLVPGLQWALRLVLLWMLPDAEAAVRAPALLRDFEAWCAQAKLGGVSPGTLRFSLAARARDIPVQRLMGGFLRLGWGQGHRKLESSFTDATGVIGTSLAKHKYNAQECLLEGGVPVARSALVSSPEEALKSAVTLGYPVVLKPVDEDQGRGVFTDLRDERALAQAFASLASRWPRRRFLLEKHQAGADYRILVAGGRVLSVIRRDPARVTGDGLASVKSLLERLNADPRRGTDPDSMLIRVEVDQELLGLLQSQELGLESVPEAGRVVLLRKVPNISRGGTAQECLPQVHPDNLAVARRAARVLGLDLAGIDFLCPDITRSWMQVGGIVCEVNAQPGLRVHWLGDESRDLNGELLDWMFEGRKPRVPVAAVTGTNGKTSTCRMLHAIWQASGVKVGVNATTGLWIGDELLTTNNLSGMPGARTLFANPDVEAAILEMPRQGLIKFGHPCDRYDVACLLNVGNDHVGHHGINSPEEMAALKGQVLELADRAVVVNAEDPLCLAVLPRCRPGARKILVARDESNPEFLRHLGQGGEGTCLTGQEGRRFLAYRKGLGQTQCLLALDEIPATRGGLLQHNETNALFAMSLALALGLPTEAIRQGLSGFRGSYADNPGRYNQLSDLPYEVMFDYAHNPDKLRELCRVVEAMPVSGRRILVCLKVGNRHRSDLAVCAPMLTRVFGGMVLGLEPNTVVRYGEYGTESPHQTMLAEFRERLLEAGADPDSLVFELNQLKALRLGFGQARPGDLLVVLADPRQAMKIYQEQLAQLNPA